MIGAGRKHTKIGILHFRNLYPLRYVLSIEVLAVKEKGMISEKNYSSNSYNIICTLGVNVNIYLLHPKACRDYGAFCFMFLKKIYLRVGPWEENKYSSLFRN